MMHLLYCCVTCMHALLEVFFLCIILLFGKEHFWDLGGTLSCQLRLHAMVLSFCCWHTEKGGHLGVKYRHHNTSLSLSHSECTLRSCEAGDVQNPKNQSLVTNSYLLEGA
jgi:hypothetical protein